MKKDFPLVLLQPNIAIEKEENQPYYSMTDGVEHPWLQIVGDLKQNEEITRKYSYPGIYSISIAGRLVYIGKSRDMLCRLAQHIFYTNNLQETKTHKYKILNIAQLMGYEIKFDTLYIATGKTEKEIDDEIGMKEGELIRKFLPPLNQQIPNIEDYHHYTINKKAKTITLMEILGKDEKTNTFNF